MGEVGMRRRVEAYAVAAIAASLVYIVWLAVMSAIVESRSANPESLLKRLEFGFGFALFFWLISGFAAAMFAMTVPWAIAVWARVKLGWDGKIYFPVVGTAMVFVVACVTSGLAPRPFFVDEETFMAGALITAERQGCVSGGLRAGVWGVLLVD